MRGPWLEEEDTYIKQNWMKTSDVALAEYLGRTRRAVHDRRLQLNCVLVRGDTIQIPRPTKIKSGPFTDDELQFMANNYRRFSTEALAAVLAREPQKIRCALWRRGLLRNDKRETDEKELKDDCQKADREMAYLMKGKKYSDMKLKPRISDCDAITATRKIEQAHKVAVRSGCGSSAAWTAEVA